MSLNALPAELLLKIASKTSSQRDLCALTLTTKWTVAVLIPEQIKLNVKHHRSSGLTWAALNHDLPLAKAFIASSANVNDRVINIHPYPVNIQDDDSDNDPLIASGKVDPPLYSAVKSEDAEMVELLLAYGADPLALLHDGILLILGEARRLRNVQIVLALLGVVASQRPQDAELLVRHTVLGWGRDM
ncbi:hypothetical protein BDW74DRAFT_181018 [Aspergillus multicolor]|uniref:uncharacterized protein n=1 Tax=Aspergillus multicolor TaxID=41759 RepID=UPI003CCE2459